MTGININEENKEELVEEVKDEFVEFDIPEIAWDGIIEKFDKGTDEVAELMGKIAGLVNVGVAPENALEYFLALNQIKHEKEINKETIKHNIEVAKINAENQTQVLSDRIL